MQFNITKHTNSYIKLCFIFIQIHLQAEAKASINKITLPNSPAEVKK